MNINFKNILAAAAITLCSISALQANPGMDLEADQPKVASILEQAKDATFGDKVQVATGVVLGNKDDLFKAGVESVKNFTSAKEVYDNLIENHKGELKWYHKVKYGIQAYAAPIAKVAVVLVKDVIVPIYNALKG